MIVHIYDTTLRDGTQGEGMSLSVDDKLKIAQRLVQLGVSYIEGGWPGSNPKDIEFFRRVGELNLEFAKVAAFGSTRKAGVLVSEDANVKALIDSGAPVTTIVGKAWDFHVLKALETTLDENIAMVRDTVKYLKDRQLEVVFDAEHYFDGFKSNEEYALQVGLAAQEAGADGIVLCDTNGGCMTW
ncbi:MAG: citramalate synthase, partial [Syntrophomonadaceae bacterium]|nr:citramalate synthase [Syntrophomonadaceae bacterium]